MINLTTNSLKALIVEILIDLDIIASVPENLISYVSDDYTKLPPQVPESAVSSPPAEI